MDCLEVRCDEIKSNIISLWNWITCIVMVITDPSGNDPNGAAAGSMSFAHNMFQSTFIMSKQGHWAVLSGGEGNGTERNHAIVKALAAMQNNQSVASSANIANSFKGIRLVKRRVRNHTPYILLLVITG